MNTPAQFFLSVFRAVGFNRPVTDYSFNGLKAAYHELLTAATPAGAADPAAVALAFVQTAFKELKTLADLLQRQPYAVVGTLQVFCVGLEPHNSTATSIWTCRILSRLVASLRSNNTPPATLIEVYQWLTDKNGPFELIFNLIESHPRLRPSLFSVMEQIGLVDLNELITSVLLEKLTDRQQYFVFVGSFVNFLTANPSSAKILEDANFPINMSQYIAATLDKSLNQETKVAAIALLTNLCLAYTRPDIDTICINILKKGCHDRSTSLRVQSIAGLFCLLDKRLEANATVAADLYKFIVFVMIEHRGEHIRPYIQRSLTAFIESHPKVPVNIIVDPFLKALTLHSYDNLDFDLIFSIAKHPQLDAKHAKKVLNFALHTSVGDILHGRLAALSVLVLMNRFRAEIVDELRSCMFDVAKRMADPTSIQIPLVVETIAKLINLRLPELDNCIFDCIEGLGSLTDRQPFLVLSKIFNDLH